MHTKKMYGYTTKELFGIFMSKVSKKPDGGCWIWSGTIFKKNGYGDFHVVGAPARRAHRASYYFHFGEFDKKMSVLHKCDVPACVNPAHLFLGTVKDNAIDMVSKGRNAVFIGSLHGQAKLTENQVIEIREMYSTGNFLGMELAKMYSVEKSTISSIINNKTWQHLDKIENKIKVLKRLGEGHSRAKLKDSDIREIRKLYDSEDPKSCNKIATKFSVTRQCISGIIKGHHWAHIK